MGSLWAYAYEMVPPQPSSRLGTIRTLLTAETAAARGGNRMWAARFVLERRATRILIVSDAPGRNRAINRRLETELKRLDPAYSVTESLAVTGRAAGDQPPPTPSQEEGPSTGHGDRSPHPK